MINTPTNLPFNSFPSYFILHFKLFSNSSKYSISKLSNMEDALKKSSSSGDKLGWLSDYSLVEFIAKGSYGGVYKALRKSTKEPCAIKITYVENSDGTSESNDNRVEIQRNRMRREFKLVAGKLHENIVNVFQSLEVKLNEAEIAELLKSVCNNTERDPKLIQHKMEYCASPRGLDALFIRMELCSITLRQWIQTCKDEGSHLWSAQRLIIFGILKGLEFLHDQNILHRDLKSENILFHETNPHHIKIADFGVGRVIHSDESLASACTTKPHTTPIYKAPELETNEYTLQADLYSLGLVILEVLTMLKSRQSAFQEVKKGRFQYEIPTKPFRNASEIVRKLTELDTKNRTQTVHSVRVELISVPDLSLGCLQHALDSVGITREGFSTLRHTLRIVGDNNKLSNIKLQDSKFSNGLFVHGSNNQLTRIGIGVGGSSNNWTALVDGQMNRLSDFYRGTEQAEKPIDVSVQFISGSGHSVDTFSIAGMRNGEIDLKQLTTSCTVSNFEGPITVKLDGTEHQVKDGEGKFKVDGDRHKFRNCKGEFVSALNSNHEITDCLFSSIIISE